MLLRYLFSVVSTFIILPPHGGLLASCLCELDMFGGQDFAQKGCIPLLLLLQAMGGKIM